MHLIRDGPITSTAKRYFLIFRLIHKQFTLENYRR
jgi:hypothetical protein